jgi:hypothetical protein
VSIIPIYLRMMYTTSPEYKGDHVMTLCLVYQEQTFINSLENTSILTPVFILNVIFMFCIVILTLVIATYISFKISHCIFRPLRKLNMKMRNIIVDGMKRDLDSEDGESSKEIGRLYEVFRSLIKTKKFENNDFMEKEDALAVIDLAEACIMFNTELPPNHKAAGICFNNIGNLQYKSKCQRREG